MKFPVTFKLKDFNIDKDEERPNWLEIFYNHLSIIQVSLFICTYNWSSLEIYISILMIGYREKICITDTGLIRNGLLSACVHHLFQYYEISFSEWNQYFRWKETTYFTDAVFRVHSITVEMLNAFIVIYEWWPVNMYWE